MLVATFFTIFLNFYKYSYYERKLYIIKKNLKKNLNQENSLKFLTGTEITPGT